MWYISKLCLYLFVFFIFCEQTCLDKKELLGLTAHHIGCSAVVAPKVILRIRGNLSDRRREKHRETPAQKNTTRT